MLNPSSVEWVGPNPGVEECKLSGADMVAQPGNSAGQRKAAWGVPIGGAGSVPTAGRRYAFGKQTGWDAVVREAAKAWERVPRVAGRVRVADHGTKGWIVVPDRRKVSGVGNKDRGADPGSALAGRDPESEDRMLRIDGPCPVKRWRAGETF